jgi:hypothetical protein
VFTDNPAVTSMSVDGTKVTVTVVSVPLVDITVTLTVFDSVGSSVTASLVLDVP